MSAAPCGYHGRYLRIDLTERRAEAVTLSADVLRRFVGGVGLGAWLLLREGGPGLRHGLVEHENVQGHISYF